ncbi:acyltransferase family protein [Homoserinibacter sp. GY 40078]|uniref:acyltransferase family protein n=1 Tax=Homoserinibacter sp. GY 40078 TaxID=2603275 RepID=UPI0011CADF31|nr:acyltransferase family protein [Homoserinibacter sp. GY 40078]TXK19197.1 acetyltransferase [Homoserinibacter sp. GY 40078]
MTSPSNSSGAATAPQTAPTTPRVAGLDGLRAFAVAVVVAFHLTPGALVGGYLGVDVFFVVSGFIITRLLLAERTRTGRIRLGAFWKRRARRLLPALVVLLLACSTLAVVVGGDVLVGLGAQLLTALTFSSNWYFIATGSEYFTESTPELFRNLWSLAVEEQFYLLWPLVLLIVLVRLGRPARIVVLAVATAASALAMALLLDPGSPTSVYYGTGTHAFGLTLGALVAVVTQWWSPRVLEWSRWSRALLGTLGVAALAGLAVLSAVMPGTADWAYRGGLLGVAVLTAVVIVACLVPGSPLARALDVRPLRWVGVRSYGIYLWHWPVFVLLAAALPTWTSDTGLAWALGGVALGITLIAAALSFRFVEQPIRRHGFRSAWRSWAAGWRRSRAAAVASTAGLVLVLGGATGTAVALVIQPATSEVESRIEAGERAAQSPSPTPPPTADPSAPPRPSGPPMQLQGDSITAIGDSVMLAAVPELQEAFPGIGIDAVVSRQMWTAPDILKKLRESGRLRTVVVLALGTNGSVSTDTLEKVRAVIGPERELVVVTAQAPRDWIPTVNERLAAFAWQHRNVELADWHAAIQPHLDELARDQVHFGHAGARIFTASIKEALQRLAALPPLRDELADESLPRPV